MREAEELEIALAGPGVVRASEMGGALWRNNSGACFDQTGRMVRYGLGNVSKKLNDVWKMPDYCGIAPGGQFAGIEWKRPGWVYRATPREVAQLNAILNVRALGGVAGFATSIEEMERILTPWPR